LAHKKLTQRQLDRKYGPSPLISRIATAHRLNIHPATADRMADRGELERVRVAGRVHFTVKSVDAVLAAIEAC
jgi:hypothetical protein